MNNNREEEMKYNEFLKELINNNACDKNQEVYIIASINDKNGYFFGSIENISLDIDDAVIIETKINIKNSTG